MDIDRPGKRQKPDRDRRRGKDDPDEAEISRLHHLAFEQLRRATDRDGEGFVERLRRWEELRRSTDFDAGDVVGLGLSVVSEEDRTSGAPTRPPSPGSALDDRDDDDDDDEDDGFEVTLSQAPSRTAQSRPTGLPPPLEIADLVARLSGEGLDDFYSVREYQKRRC